jgi:hypothetical protein
MGISRVFYRHGMVQSLRNLRGLEQVELSGDGIPAAVLTAIEENKILQASGEYGDRDVGEPIEYDHLVVEHSSGRTEITFYNRGISLVFGDSETERQIHRVCVILEQLAQPRA